MNWVYFFPESLDAEVSSFLRIVWFQVIPHKFLDVLWFLGSTDVGLRFCVLPQNLWRGFSRVSHAYDCQVSLRPSVRQ